MIEVASGQTARTLEGEGSGLAFSFSSDGRYLVGAGQGRVTIWEPATGRVVSTRRFASPNAAMFAPRGHQVLVIGGYDAMLLDAASGKELWHAKPGGLLHAAAFSPDGKQFAVSSSFRDSPSRGWMRRLFILDIATGKMVREIAR